VLQFFEMRRILEPAAAALAADRAEPDTVDGLRQVVEDLAPEAGIDRLVANDLEFHRRVAAASANPVLRSVADAMAAPTTRARIWRGLTQPGAAARTRQQHTAILDAIAARRPDIARCWATVHVHDVEEWLRTALGGGPRLGPDDR
jgi:DNA-binding FadR family transcriptional regulator